MGKAMSGKLKGAELKVIPSVMTDWKTWKTEHPGSDVLDLRRTTHAFVTEVQKEPGSFTLGLRTGGAVVDFPFDALKRASVVSSKAGTEPVLVTFDEDSATARVFSRKVNGSELKFLRDGGTPNLLIDSKTKSIWNPSSGICTKGTMKGKQLEMLPGIPSFIRAWRVFYPNSTTYSAP